MEVIPVLDLRQGRAVHATGGDRSRYGLVKSALAPDAEGDPLTLARAYRSRLGARRCYLADLDALLGGPSQLGLIARLADPASGFGPGLLVDSAVTSAGDAQRLLAGGASEVIVGLESLRQPEDLSAVVAAVGADRVVFSLDLRGARPVTAPAAAKWAGEGTPAKLAGLAVAAGIGTILVLDLARIGAAAGPAIGTIRELRASLPDVTLLAGGGIRGVSDLEALERLGVAGALVGTALHRGALDRYIERRKVAD
jgi:phosphoribosylformimino-5-aminoimidazole carboxamide ribotide isomerase